MDTNKGNSMELIFNQEYINDKLRELGNCLIRDEYKSLWSEDSPTTGYCYILSEVIYHYTNGDYKIFRFSYDNNTKSHWFLKRNGEVIDMTFNQFDNEDNFDKSEEKETEFYEGIFETPKGKISERGYNLAKYLGFVD